MEFGEALRLLKKGKLIRRDAWPEGTFVYLVAGSQFAVNRKPLNEIYPEGTEISYRAHIDARHQDGSCEPWFASSTDILANDWIETTA